MSSQEQYANFFGGSPGGGASEAPSCPKCQRRMEVKQITPVLFAQKLDDVVYGCDRCGTEAKRTVKRT